MITQEERKLEDIFNYKNKENFIEWFCWSVYYKDLDPAVWLTNYLNNRYEHNTEQKYWLCWLYANTYYFPTTWIIFNEFPDFELVDVNTLENWHNKNYHRLRYQCDTKWNKGHLVSMFKSYKEFIGDLTQQEKFSLICCGNKYDNFKNLFSTVKKDLYKFGRYSTWFYLQHLKQTVNLEIDPPSLILNDYSGSRSHRNGLLYALNMEDKIDKKLNKLEYNVLEEKSLEILELCKIKLPSHYYYFDLFNMETALCSFKKIFRVKKGRYLGYYLDRQSEEIISCEKDGWDGIDWDVLWQARKESLDNRLLNNSINKNNFNNFLDTKNIYHENIMWSKL